VAAGSVYLAERGGEGPIQSFGDSLWWAMATITTVGYGDVYPKTPAGRGVAVVLMLLGISLFSILTARIASFFVAPEESDHPHEELDAIRARLERIEAHLSELARDRGGREEP
jgi:voltage-gated potassium channel